MSLAFENPQRSWYATRLSYFLSSHVFPLGDENQDVSSTSFFPYRLLPHIHYIYVCVFLGLHPRHVEVPRLAVELELQPPTTAIATATWDLSHVCDLHHSSQQRRILHPLSEARDPTCNLMDESQIRFHWATMGTPRTLLFLRSPWNYWKLWFAAKYLRTVEVLKSKAIRTWCWLDHWKGGLK